MPTVSICLPVYNGARYLGQAIESALGQTHEDFELLIANDCSTDESAAIADSFAQRDNRVRAWTNDRNLGHYPNYNACIERAAGKYIKLFAQDDILHPQFLSRMLGVFENNASVSLAATTRLWIDADGKPIPAVSEIDVKLTKLLDQDTLIPGAQAITETLKEATNWIGEPSNQMFRAEFIDGGFDTSFNQIGDLEYNYRLLERGDYYYIADELCHFRKHSSSWTKSNNAELRTYLDWFLLAAKYRRYLNSAGMSPEEFCLAFMKAWTRNLECELNHANRLGKQDRPQVLRELLGNVDPFSLFNCEKNAKRDLVQEYKLLGALALFQTAVLENEIRIIHDETARHWQDFEPEQNPIMDLRPGLAKALEGMKETLKERDKEIKALRQALDEMGNSASWKMTEPLRKLRGGLN